MVQIPADTCPGQFHRPRHRNLHFYSDFNRLVANFSIQVCDSGDPNQCGNTNKIFRITKRTTDDFIGLFLHGPESCDEDDLIRCEVYASWGACGRSRSRHLRRLDRRRFLRFPPMEWEWAGELFMRRFKTSLDNTKKDYAEITIDEQTKIRIGLKVPESLFGIFPSTVVTDLPIAAAFDDDIPLSLILLTPAIFLAHTQTKPVLFLWSNREGSGMAIAIYPSHAVMAVGRSMPGRT